MLQVLIGDNLDESHISGRIFSFSARLDNKPAPLLSENCVFIFPAPRARFAKLSSPCALLILDLGLTQIAIIWCDSAGERGAMCVTRKAKNQRRA